MENKKREFFFLLFYEFLSRVLMNEACEQGYEWSERDEMDQKESKEPQHEREKIDEIRREYYRVLRNHELQNIMQ